MREFAEAEIAPHAEALGPRPHVSRSTPCSRWASSGCSVCRSREEYGGGGADYLTYCLAIEELARVDSSMAITLEAGVSLGAAPFLYSGTEAQKQEYLVPMIAGEVLGAFGLTEAEAGSDAGATRTRATLDDADARVGDRRPEDVHHQLGHADHEVRHDHRAHRRRTRSRTSSSTPGTPGFAVHAAVPQDGLARLRHARARVRRLPRSRGPPARRARRGLQDRSCASSTTAASRSPRSRSGSRRRASTRRSRTPRSAEAFGGPIGRYQSIAFKCADMAVAVENARNLTYKAACLRDQGRADPAGRRRWRSSTRARSP